MKLIAQNKEFKIYFDCTQQTYLVYKNDKFLISSKYKYSDVKIYLT